ncbi:MAG: hypothetical protein CTY10_06730 [Methylotenera sp.]|nr:MAG: hypothetical protein CTY10_06730 [Methylotenera sp.]
MIFEALRNLGNVNILIVGDGSPDFFAKFFLNSTTLTVIRPFERGEIGFWKHIRPVSPKVIDLVSTAFGSRKYLYMPDKNFFSFTEKICEFDLVVGRYLRPTVRSGALHFINVPVIVDVDDRDDVIFKSRLNRPDTSFFFKFFFKWHLKQMQIIMPNLLPMAKHLWVTSKSDYLEIKHESKSILPNIPFTNFNNKYIPLPENHTSNVILFVGSFGHRVNREGIERFITNCWPKIISVETDAKLRIVGSGGWETIKNKYNHISGIDIAGFKDSLEAEYKNAAFTVTPLFEGGGTKIKVLESLFYQRATLVTTHAHYGYDKLVNNKSILVASNESELIAGCINLLQNSKLRSRLAEEGRKIVFDEYSFERFSSLIKDTIKSIA